MDGCNGIYEHSMSDFNVPYICSMSCDRLGFYEDPNYFLGGQCIAKVLKTQQSPRPQTPDWRS